MLKTVDWVCDSPSEHTANGTTTYYINVKFTDGEGASLGKRKLEKALELRMLLIALKGTPVEFGLEDRGKTLQDGHKKYAIKSFPGYEPTPYQGGQKSDGGAKKGDWETSAERAIRRQMEADKDASIIAEVALRQATSMALRAFAPSDDPAVGTGILSRTEVFDAMVEAVQGATPKLAQAVRESSVPREVPAVQMSDPGLSFAGGEASSESPPEAEPTASSGSPDAVAPGSPGSDSLTLAEARNIALKKFGNSVNKVENAAAQGKTLEESKDFRDLTVEELLSL